MRKKPKILVFLPYYLPGYKSGGILRTVVNTVHTLGVHFDFFIVTKDRDLGDVNSYPEVKADSWNNIDGAMVYYLSPKNCNIKYIYELVRQTPHDIIHLNSFFDNIFTLKFLLLRRLGLLRNESIILSPRGELVEGCIKIKYLKKFLFITISKLFGLYENITWHASSEHEALGFKKVMRVNSTDIRIALDLPSRLDLPETNITLFSDSHLRVIFISRLTREKNLDFALHIFRNVKANIIFDIYGPCEDVAYWNECLELINQLPSNIITNYRGAVSPDVVLKIVDSYDLFFFPSRGENYGHVIAESLSVGTKVLTSKNTPWLNLARDGLGWDVDLEDSSVFSRIIEDFAAEPMSVRLDKRVLVREAASKRILDLKVIDDNRILFESIL